ncbi:unnamed protein product [Ostreobium quekettii]|uniref:Polymorphic outer membrane protein n=1 Tax=Ostreobium quekettii TaxID=121088 RepID=A0A8S1IVU6_9CHLO|nr:unnamed protein product [Ostreobium quekettii]
MDNCRLAVNGVVFQNNTALVLGGALHAQGSLSFINDEVEVDIDREALALDMDLKDFSAGQSAALRAVVDLTHVRFIGNTAIGAGGGAISSDANADLSVDNAEFLGNMANGTGGPSRPGGGAIRARSSRVRVSNSTFLGNASPLSNGGAIALTNTREFSTRFIRSNVLQVSNGTSFVRNMARSGGALFMGSFSSSSLDGAKFSSNTAQISGGAVFFSEGDGMEIRNSTFRRNSATLTGGALHFEYRQAGIEVNLLISLQNTTFSENRGGDGGAVFGTALVSSGEDLSIDTMRDPVMLLTDTLQMMNATFQGNVAGADGGGMLLRGIEALLKDVRLVDNVANGSGGGAFFGRFSVLNGTQMRFVGNSAQREGGGLKLGSNTNIDDRRSSVCRDCAFGSNRATSGGALWVDAFSVLQLQLASITSNSAVGGGGGAIFSVSPSNIFIQCNSTEGQDFPLSRFAIESGECQDFSVTENLAMDGFGNAFAGPPRTLSVQMSGSFKEHRSGDILSRITVMALDEFDNVVTGAATDGPLLVRASPTSGEVEVTGQTLVEAIDGMAVFAFLVLRAPVSTKPSNATVLFSTSLEGVSPVNATVKVAACRAGELVDENAKLCRNCPTGRFSFNPNNATCDECPGGAVCRGGSSMVPSSGQWHSHPLSTQIHKCINMAACSYPNRTESLLRSRSLNDASGEFSDLENYSQCAEGYKDVLCGSCAPGYGFEKQGICTKCNGDADWVIFAAQVIFVTAFLAWQVKSNIHYDDGNSTYLTSDILKVLVSYFQVMGLARIIDLDWPDPVDDLLKAEETPSNVNFASFAALDCILNDSGFPRSIKRAIVVALFPVMMVCAGTLFWALLSLMPSKSASVRRFFYRNVLVTAFVALFLSYPSVVRSTLEIFDCVDVDADDPSLPYAGNATAQGSFWKVDTRQKCFEGDHRMLTATLGATWLVAFCLGVPLALLAFLTRRRDRLHRAESIRDYGFLYRSYTADLFFWEAVILTRKLLVVVVLVFGDSLAVQRQNTLVLGVLTAALFLQMRAAPFQTPKLNRLEAASLTTSTATFFIGSFASGGAPHGWRVFSTAAILAANGGLLAWFALELLAALKRDLEGRPDGCGGRAWSLAKAAAGWFVEKTVARCLGELTFDGPAWEQAGPPREAVPEKGTDWMQERPPPERSSV